MAGQTAALTAAPCICPDAAVVRVCPIYPATGCRLPGSVPAWSCVSDCARTALQRHAPWGSSSINYCFKHLVHNDDAPGLDAAGKQALLAQAGSPPVCVRVRLVTFNLEDVFGTHPQKLVRTCKYEQLELLLHTMPGSEGGAQRVLVAAVLPPHVTQNGPSLQQAGQIRNLFDIFRRVNGIYQWNGEATHPEAFSQLRRLMSDLEKACGAVEARVYLGADPEAGIDPDPHVGQLHAESDAYTHPHTDLHTDSHAGRQGEAIASIRIWSDIGLRRRAEEES